MMKLIKPSRIKGTVTAPGSKSMLQRAIAISLLCSGKSTIYNPTYCDDVRSAIRIAEELGAHIICEKNKIEIDPPQEKKVTAPKILNCGEAGLCLRMFTPIATLFSNNFQITLSGEGSLLKRPIKMIEEPLNKLGLKVVSNSGLLPITVAGRLKGGDAEIDGSISSQFLTGLLIVLPCAENDSNLVIHNLKSKPYIDMTLSIMKCFGISLAHTDYRSISIKGGQKYHPAAYFVEGDWSGAAFLLVAGAIAGEIKVKNLYLNSFQGDKKILAALKKVGAKIVINDKEGFVCSQKNKLEAFEFDATDCPDLFPPLTALASACNGTSRIKGVSRLKFKESNRGETLKAQFHKMGIKIKICHDFMEISGGTIKEATVDSCQDHRIAMACAVAALAGKEGVAIENGEVVNKSYPHFFTDLQSIME